jgi:sigma-B regulation protein RsbU (phosphoserine phosphatase)
MDAKVSERIQVKLAEKHDKLSSWLHTMSETRQENPLGPVGIQEVQEHLEVLEDAMEKAATDTLGVCKICHYPVDESLIEMDYLAEVCLAHFSPQEIRSLEYELELSQIVQRALLPQQVPQISGVELAAFSRPAQIVGGDFFDFLSFGSGAQGLVIADVAGKGMSAGMIMASVQTALRALVPVSSHPVEVLTHLNRIFSHNIQFTTFVTLFLGAYDPATRLLTYCNAGHNPPLLAHQAGGFEVSFEWLKPTGAAIGLVEDPQFQAQQVQLQPRDTLLLYTDGVTETFNSQDEEFGYERLADFTRRSMDLPVKNLIHALQAELQVFAHDHQHADDLTIIACRIGE